MLVKRDWVAIYNADVTPMKERLKKYISRKILQWACSSKKVLAKPMENLSEKSFMS